MTRKRYIKLLMACGHDRKWIDGQVRKVRLQRTSYRQRAVFWARGFANMERITPPGPIHDMALRSAHILWHELYTRGKPWEKR